MSVSIPHELMPLVNAMGVRWPDIDEDQITELAGDISDFGSGIQEVSLTVADVLSDLRHENRSDALVALCDHWARLQTKYIDPVCDPGTGLLDQAARYCRDGANAITWYKDALLTYLGGELVAFTLSGGVAGIAKFAGRKEIDKAVEGLAEDAARKAADSMLTPLQKEVHDKLHSLVDEALNELGQEVVNAAQAHLPTVTLTTLEQQLVISAQSLERARTKVENSANSAWVHGQALTTAKESKTFLDSTSGTDADPTLRHRIGTYLDQFVPDLVGECESICTQLIAHVTGLVNLVGNQISLADEKLSTDVTSRTA